MKIKINKKIEGGEGVCRLGFCKGDEMKIFYSFERENEEDE